jgi:hypothetical protein
VTLPLRLLLEAYGVPQAAIAATAGGTPATVLRGLQVTINECNMLLQVALHAICA